MESKRQKLGAPKVDAKIGQSPGETSSPAQPLVLVVCQSQAPRCGLCVWCRRRRSEPT